MGNINAVMSYVAQKAEDGEYYLRSRNIADDLSLSSKQVGQELARINDVYEDIVTDDPEYAEDDDIPESLQWGRHNSTTWYAKPLKFDDVFQQVQDELPL